MPALTSAATPQTIAEAAALLRAGRLVAFPTETVYGLGGDATNARAVADIFAAKGRPRFNPLIMHVPGLPEAERLAGSSRLSSTAARRRSQAPSRLGMVRAPAAGTNQSGPRPEGGRMTASRLAQQSDSR